MISNQIAVISNWPEHPNAERENIARIKVAAGKIGVSVIIIDKNGYDLATGIEIENDDIDFVISLHFETPKSYDAYSYIALWNPLAFYFEWGYKKCSDHVVSHDDTLSCLSSWADDHIQRLIYYDKTRLPPIFTLNHSVADPIFKPKLLNNPKFFYCGINWERLGNKKGRFEDILLALDKKNIIKIYGPKVVRGVKVWAGFRNYVKSIPFDGKTIISEIAKCGISLVLSSEAHYQSSLMSNRLFESLAAGAIIIADHHPFIREYFGDNVLYIKNSGTNKEITQEIMHQYHWIKKYPEKAQSMATQAQKIFLEKFELSKQLKEIVTHHSKRKAQLEALYLAKNEEIHLNLLHILPRPNLEEFEVFLTSLAKQSYKNYSLFVYINSHLASDEDISLYKSVASDLNIKCDFIETLICNSQGKILVSCGKLIAKFTERLMENDYMHVSVGNVKFFTHHLSSIIRKINDKPEYKLYYSDVIIKHKDQSNVEHRELFKIRPDSLNNCANIFFTPFTCKAHLLKNEASHFINYLDNLLFLYLFELVKNSKSSTNKSTVLSTSIYEQQLLSNQQQLEIFKERFPFSYMLVNQNELDIYSAIDQLPSLAKAKLAEDILRNIPLKKTVRSMAINIYRVARDYSI